jgi:SAM-dependent methyltransferase
MLDRLSRSLFSARTLKLIKFDLKRARARWKRHGERELFPPCPKLHLGCGSRRVPGWLNVDITKSNCDVDLCGGRLPWKAGCFEAVVSQHFIEHAELREELIPLLRELRRVLIAGGEIWLSCPDIEKVCRSYLEHRMVDLLEDRAKRWLSFSLADVPAVHLINHLFHQDGEHKNLFDFELLEWILRTTGFVDIKRVAERDLLARFPEFPRRDDDLQTLYVRAVASREQNKPMPALR